VISIFSSTQTIHPGEKMTLTNKEIAKKLNISETTLSFITNNKPGIAERTRNRVVQELELLGYGHILKKEMAAISKCICFAVYKRHGDILNQSPFFMLLMEQIDERARAAGFNVLVRMIDSAGSMDDQIRAINASDISGTIIFATEMLDDDMEHFKYASAPVVSLDNDFTHLEMDSVVINNRVGTLKAIEHLVEFGHKEVGYLHCKTFINSFGEREEGYKKALARFGLELDPRHIFRLGFTEEESYQDFKKILSSGAKLPTAFVSDDDTMAAGAMRAMIEHGIQVPDAVSVVGFDNRPLCERIQPHLTSISVPTIFGARAVDLLVDRISNPIKEGGTCDFRKIEVGVQLIARESSGHPVLSMLQTTQV